MGENQPVPRASVDVFQDVLYDILANTDRRHVLQHLATHENSLSVDQLGDELISMMSQSADQTEQELRQKHYLTGLVHVHLPKLCDVGLIQWDQETNEVSATSLLRELSATTVGEGSKLSLTKGRISRSNECGT